MHKSSIAAILLVAIFALTFLMVVFAAMNSAHVTSENNNNLDKITVVTVPEVFEDASKNCQGKVHKIEVEPATLQDYRSGAQNFKYVATCGNGAVVSNTIVRSMIK